MTAANGENINIPCISEGVSLLKGCIDILSVSHSSESTRSNACDVSVLHDFLDNTKSGVTDGL